MSGRSGQIESIDAPVTGLATATGTEKVSSAATASATKAAKPGVPSETKPQSKSSKKRTKVFLIVLAVLLVVLGIFLALYFLVLRKPKPLEVTTFQLVSSTTTVPSGTVQDINVTDVTVPVYGYFKVSSGSFASGTATYNAQNAATITSSKSITSDTNGNYWFPLDLSQIGSQTRAAAPVNLTLTDLSNGKQVTLSSSNSLQVTFTVSTFVITTAPPQTGTASNVNITNSSTTVYGYFTVTSGSFASGTAQYNNAQVATFSSPGRLTSSGANYWFPLTLPLSSSIPAASVELSLTDTLNKSVTLYSSNTLQVSLGVSNFAIVTSSSSIPAASPAPVSVTSASTLYAYFKVASGTWSSASVSYNGDQVGSINFSTADPNGNYWIPITISTAQTVASAAPTLTVNDPVIGTSVTATSNNTVSVPLVIVSFAIVTAPSAPQVMPPAAININSAPIPTLYGMFSISNGSFVSGQITYGIVTTQVIGSMTLSDSTTYTTDTNGNYFVPLQMSTVTSQTNASQSPTLTLTDSTGTTWPSTSLNTLTVSLVVSNYCLVDNSQTVPTSTPPGLSLTQAPGTAYLYFRLVVGNFQSVTASMFLGSVPYTLGTVNQSSGSGDYWLLLNTAQFSSMTIPASAVFISFYEPVTGSLIETLQTSNTLAIDFSTVILNSYGASDYETTFFTASTNAFVPDQASITDLPFESYSTNIALSGASGSSLTGTIVASSMPSGTNIGPNSNQWSGMNFVVGNLCTVPTDPGRPVKITTSDGGLCWDGVYDRTIVSASSCTAYFSLYFPFYPNGSGPFLSSSQGTYTVTFFDNQNPPYSACSWSAR